MRASFSKYNFPRLRYLERYILPWRIFLSGHGRESLRYASRQMGNWLLRIFHVFPFFRCVVARDTDNFHLERFISMRLRKISPDVRFVPFDSVFYKRASVRWPLCVHVLFKPPGCFLWNCQNELQRVQKRYRTWDWFSVIFSFNFLYVVENVFTNVIALHYSRISPRV